MDFLWFLFSISSIALCFQPTWNWVHLYPHSLTNSIENWDYLYQCDNYFFHEVIPQEDKAINQLIASPFVSGNSFK